MEAIDLVVTVATRWRGSLSLSSYTNAAAHFIVHPLATRTGTVYTPRSKWSRVPGALPETWGLSAPLFPAEEGKRLVDRLRDCWHPMRIMVTAYSEFLGTQARSRR
jgi:hypothetical protein